MRHLEARDSPPEAPNGGPDGGFTQPPTVEIGVAFGAFLSFSACLLCLSPFVIERRTAQHAGLIANPPCALQLPCLSFVVMLVVINHQKFFLPTHHFDDSCRGAC